MPSTGSHSYTLIKYETEIPLRNERSVGQSWRRALQRGNLPMSFAQKTACLVVLATEQAIPLSSTFMWMGREESRLGIFPEIPLPCGMPGWLQALLRAQNGSYTIEDLTRLNQTKVNGVILKPKQQYPLHDGDLLQVGQVELRFEQCL